MATPGTANKPGTVGAGRTAYSTSKLAVIYFVHVLARNLPAGVQVFFFDPGLVPGTRLARDAGPVSRFLFRQVMPVMTLTPSARTRSVSGRDLATAATGPLEAESRQKPPSAGVRRFAVIQGRHE